MYYCAIKRFDVANGEGVRVSLFVSGCRNRCKGCFQPETWSFTYGEPFGKAAEEEIISVLRNPSVRGLTVLGGEPMEPENQVGLLPFLKKIKAEFPEKTVWLYTGNLYEELTGETVCRDTITDCSDDAVTDCSDDTITDGADDTITDGADDAMIESENRNEMAGDADSATVESKNCDGSSARKSRVFLPITAELLSLVDILVDGRYEEDKHRLGLRFRGSENQRIIDMNKTRAEGKIVIWQGSAEDKKWSGKNEG